MNEERRTQNSELRKRWFALLFFILNSAFCVLNSYANELTVDRTTLNPDDTLTITLSLDNAFTSLDSVSIPVQNLRILGAPSVSSQITWVNGTLTQRKSFQYQARPIAAGGALVGPVVLETRDGQRETLSPVAVQVLPDLAAGSNDPQTVLRELIATHRDPIFLVAEVDRTTAYVGEEVVVTWSLYNGASVEQWEIANVPDREDFWSEQLEIGSEHPEMVMFGQTQMQKLVIMRLALFPLHAGALTIGPLEVRAEIMRRDDAGSPFGIFEGNVIDITRHNAPVTINVLPVPAGPPVDVVGEVAMNCGKARQANGGPVVVDVGLSGRANLRTAAPPHWLGKLDGSTQIEEGKLNVMRGAGVATMTRQWRLLVFPAHAGLFTLPPLVTHAFSPAAGRQDLQCNAATLHVTAAAAPLDQPPQPRQQRPPRSFRPSASTLIGVAIVIIGAIGIRLIAPRIRRASALRRRAREIATPHEEVRAKLAALLAANRLDEASLMREQSDRGDAYRSLQSRLEFEPPDKEVEFRLRDFLQFLK